MKSDLTVSSRQSRWIVYLLIGVVTFLVLFTLRATQQSGMAMGFASSAQGGWFSFVPHHLLYQPIIRLLFESSSFLGCDAFCAGQAWGIFWAIVTVLAVYAIVQRTSGSQLAAVLAVVFTLVSHGFLIYATQIEPYGPMLGMMTLLAAILMLNDGPPLSWKLSILFIAIFALGLFHHQAMVLFLIPVAYYAISVSGRAGFNWFCLVTILTGVPVLATFALVFWSENPSGQPIQFIRWMMYYAVTSGVSHGTFLIDLMDRVVGLARNIVALFLVLPGSDSIDIVETGDEPWRKFVRISFLAFLTFVFFWSAWQAIYQRSRARLRLFLLVWVAAFGVFGYWWQSYVYKFFIPIITPMAILAGLSVNDWVSYLAHRRQKAAVVFFVSTTALLVFLSNTVTTVYPVHASRGAIFSQAQKLDAAAPKECVIYSKRYLSGDLGHYLGRKIRPYNYMFKGYWYSNIDPAVTATLGQSIDFDGDTCGVIPLYWASREFFTWGANQKGNAHINPEDYGIFVAWFFEVLPDEGESGITYSKFRVTEDQSGERYLIIDRTARSHAESLDSLMREIDKLYAQKPSLAFYPDAEGVGILRRLAFGYN